MGRYGGRDEREVCSARHDLPGHVEGLRALPSSEACERWVWGAREIRLQERQQEIRRPPEHASGGERCAPLAGRKELEGMSVAWGWGPRPGDMGMRHTRHILGRTVPEDG